MDGAILFSDILVIPQALGQKLEFLEGEGPKLASVRSREDIQKLDHQNIHQTLSPIYETVSNVCAGLKNEGFSHVSMIGFAGSPWTIASYMVEGAGSREFIQVKSLAYRDEALFQELIDIITQATTEYLLKQIEAGAEIIQLFDSWAGALDPAQFAKWVIAPTQRIITALKVQYPGIPVIGFAKGAGVNILDYAQQSGADVIGLDQHIPQSWAAENIQSLKPVQGNLDPISLFAGGVQLERNIDHILENFQDRPFIFNLGHGIHKDTPISHVEMAVKKIKACSLK
jgi:uroporphyrinogen decarboxylase